mmetsp:Transcript_1011/g.2818  ORF Transcript_1011/g.2818 Transcript_1011/m.2818 type:complete len:859 (-) Transcript_1011:126-2702(-)|eukprot:CAMPEP_0168734764 /NCGR_PEP_ID=MMETSP0724-20121128/8984_1 /TAXON_ID=265536 /ORGANISM="Amphiprora sp., Strain CCMP467" /LENGTH=858 /DNA_ID=CAMNT_0008781883 /DNA_START=69 /DNA_END=2645 /DNA_ORIENTATION=+
MSRGQDDEATVATAQQEQAKMIRRRRTRSRQELGAGTSRNNTTRCAPILFVFLMIMIVDSSINKYRNSRSYLHDLISTAQALTTLSSPRMMARRIRTTTTTTTTGNVESCRISLFASDERDGESKSSNPPVSTAASHPESTQKKKEPKRRNQNKQSNHGHNHRRRRQRQQQQHSSLGQEDPLLSLNLNLDALVQAQATDRAQELYQRIRALHADGYYATAPDVVSFNTILKGLARNPHAALDFWHEQVFLSSQQQQRQDEEEMEQENDYHPKANHDEEEEEEDDAPPPVQPNTRSFNTILLSLANSGLYEPALDILRQMRQFDSRVVPDIYTYNTVLLAFASNAECPYSNQPAELAEELLQEMMESTNSSNSARRVDDDDAGVGDEMDGSLFWGDNNPAMDEVEHWTHETEMLKPAVAPDVISFNTVLAAWARRGNALKALEWLKRIKTYNSTSGSKRKAVLPDAYSYTTVIQALATTQPGNNRQKETLGNRAEMALSLLQEMLQQSTQDYHQNGNVRMSPNIFTYTAVVRVLCKSRQPDKAHDLIQQMWQHYNDYYSDKNESKSHDEEDARPVCPNVVTYSSLMQGWSQLAAEQPERAVEKAQSILKEMKAHSRHHPEVTPNQYTYTAMLNTLAQARLKEGPQLARQIMKQDLLLPLGKQGGDKESSIAVYPSLIHFNAWLDVVAKAPLAHKAVEAAKIYNFMVSTLGISGDSVTFNTILAAAANAFGPAHVKKKSLDIGRAAYAKLTLNTEDDKEDALGDDGESTDSLRPNSLTYLNMMKMLRKYNNDDVDEWRSVITSCLEQGGLNSICLQYLEKHAPRSSWPDELSEAVSSNLDLPDSWSRHALREKRSKTRSY